MTSGEKRERGKRASETHAGRSAKFVTPVTKSNEAALLSLVLFFSLYPPIPHSAPPPRGDGAKLIAEQFARKQHLQDQYPTKLTNFSVLLLLLSVSP